jgi:tetratricopeptide (TPR) repeat protein
MPEQRSSYLSRVYMGLLTLVIMIAIGAVLFRHSQIRSTKIETWNLYLTKANALMRHDKFDEAVAALEKATKVNPGDIHTETELLKARIFKLATRYDQLDRFVDLQQLDDAQKDCERLLRNDPNSAELTALLGIIYAHRDLPGMAIETYKKAIALKETYANVHNYWGYTAYQWHYPDNWRKVAEEEFNQAKDLDPKYPMPRINLALLSVLEHDFKTADDILRATQDITNDNELLYLLWGTSFSSWGGQLQDTNKLEAYKKFSEALDKFRVAEAIKADVVDLHFNRGMTLAALGNVDAAIEEYQAAIKLEPDLLVAHENLAELLYRKKDFEGSLLQLQHSLRIIKQIIEQFETRASRTTDDHAQKLLRQWAEDKKKEKIKLDDYALQLKQEMQAANRSN